VVGSYFQEIDMLSNLKLGTKFNLMLSIVFLGGIILSGFTLWQVLNNRAQSEITTQGLILIETMNAVRSYTSSRIQPLLSEDLASQPAFISETVPAFSAGAVFENFRARGQHADFLYREAALNPTNPTHKADDFEAQLVEKMRHDRTIKEVSDFRELNGQRVYFIARPLAIGSESCLYCHSTPEVAPASLIATYGSENGFGWQLNEVVAAQIIYVPADEVFNATVRSFTLVMGIFVVIFALVLILINVLLTRYVIEPVGVLGGLAQKICADEMEPAHIATGEFLTISNRTDELGSLAQVFRRMAQEVYSRTQNLKKQVMELRIEIDEIKQHKEVAAITDSEFFQDLQMKARSMRKSRAEGRK
jgi:HAMP domain-containing protein